MRLKAAQEAPLFSTEDILGRHVDLKALRGRPVLLAMHRFSTCPFCNLRVHQLSLRYEAYEKQGLFAVAVFESSKQNLIDGVARQKAPFAIVSNPDLSLYSLYGAEKSVLGMLRTAPSMLAVARETKEKQLVQKVAKEGSALRMPADFLIAPDGRIHTAFYGTNMGDHLPFAQIDAFVAEHASARSV